MLSLISFIYWISLFTGSLRTISVLLVISGYVSKLNLVISHILYNLDQNYTYNLSARTLYLFRRYNKWV